METVSGGGGGQQAGRQAGRRVLVCTVPYAPERRGGKMSSRHLERTTSRRGGTRGGQGRAGRWAARQAGSTGRQHRQAAVVLVSERTLKTNNQALLKPCFLPPALYSAAERRGRRRRRRKKRKEGKMGEEERHQKRQRGKREERERRMEMT